VLVAAVKQVWNAIWDYTKGVVLAEILAALKITLPPLVVSAILIV
jgi:hypothetical protein